MGEQMIPPGQGTIMVHSDAIDDSDTAMVNSYLVDWDEPDDPENPMNWSKCKKALFITTLGYISTLSPLASSIAAPGIASIKSDFNVTDTYVGAFMISGFLIGYCCGPLFIAPLSEMYGRYVLYNAGSLLFLIFNVACSVAPNSGSMIAFRIFAGIGGSTPLTLGAASLADTVPREKRGLAMMVWTLGPMVGPTIGPIAGGYLSETIGWRWSFRVVSVAAGVAALGTAFCMPESYALTLLERKARRLRLQTRNPHLESVLATHRKPKDLFMFSILRPAKMMFLSPIVFCLSVYMAILYGYLYLLFTTFPQVFKQQYGFSQGSAGLAYIGIGVGSVIGLLFSGLVSDRLVLKLSLTNGGQFQPEYRLPPMLMGAILVPIGLFWYGWTADKQLQWMLPIIGTAILGCGIVIVLVRVRTYLCNCVIGTDVCILKMSISTYLVDAFTTYAASAMAASTVTRSLLGAFLPLAGDRLYQSLGLGWGNSLLGFIAFVMIPIPLVFYRYGQVIRQMKLFKTEF
ncbi:fluconazole resistance protein [Colletotrichum paranaense]|uniref:Fluconazole resistance protein n=1 Tax=Colletotrichum paranaense TaxID=1914294 RepID=A0ABQ9T3Z1_9PEZI|nr:fluconazole resistance protein [Colletotrichum paranaense]KAK1546498.1 fluconazole resistance protein [Colletotrichum paranaense]